MTESSSKCVKTNSKEKVICILQHSTRRWMLLVMSRKDKKKWLLILVNSVIGKKDEDNFVKICQTIKDKIFTLLLGHNICKPLEAEIKLFKSGDGIIKLGKVDVEILEKRGGHYLLRVQDLRKLCENASVSTFLTKQTLNCDKCSKHLWTQTT